MKTQILTLCMIFFTLAIYGQVTKLVVTKNKGQISERFYVLQSDKTIKHGEYISYYTVMSDEYKKIKKGTLSIDEFFKEKGFYNLGKKDSLWIEYHAPQRTVTKMGSQSVYGKIKSQGYYKDDKKVGVWLTFKEEITERFDYDLNKKLTPIIKIKPDYPKSAIEAELQGKVVVRYKIHNDCSISDIEIIQSLSPDCDQSVIRMIKKLSTLYKKYQIDCEEKTETMDLDFNLL
jgi:TonB family protein